MSWIVAMMLCFILWSAYAIPGNVAEKVHGTPVNMLFETLAFVMVAILLSGKIIEGMPRVTLNSAMLASLMGIGSAVGFYLFLTALSLAPGTKGIVLVVLMAGITFPVQGALFSFSGKAEDTLSLRQWLAIAGMGVSLIVYNWNWK